MAFFEICSSPIPNGNLSEVLQKNQLQVMIAIEFWQNGKIIQTVKMNRKDINYNKLYNYGITKSNEVELRYKDDEGDMIQLKNDQDVEEMFYDNRRKLEIFISNKMKLNANLDAMESTLQKMSIAFSIWKCPPAYIRLKIEFGRILNMKNTRIAIAKVVTMPQV